MGFLKPCPFCGGTDLICMRYDPFDGYQGNLTQHVVRCNGCGAEIERKDRLDVIRAWNRRASDG